MIYCVLMPSGLTHLWRAEWIFWSTSFCSSTRVDY